MQCARDGLLDTWTKFTLVFGAVVRRVYIARGVDVYCDGPVNVKALYMEELVSLML